MMTSASKQWSEWVADESGMQALGARLSSVFPDKGLIYLHGDLGAGKSTLVRGFINASGYQGYVKSPTYTLVEPYTVPGHHIYHLDLYRLADPEELEFIGFRDLLADQSIVLIEWPDKAQGWLPEADLDVYIQYSGQGRDVLIVAKTEPGIHAINAL